ncbi:MAG: superoxide dismutase [Coxiella sp. RIFCSPHIGHO2_12_FULL_42_15]|nr:MAG: superoxide dismutase [Coxiella sp. RIFCSPHIGHO2_12_FULL_42_15]
MPIKLPQLPYEMNALEPHISAETLQYHYGKHHKAYVDKLNSLIPGTPFEKMSLEEILLKSDGGIFNNAAQIWNHTFYWHCMSPLGGGEPDDALAALIEQYFESVAKFKESLTHAAITRFGSGWAWLVADKKGKLEIVSTSNADNPMTEGKIPLLTCDVWEHAYYIDTRNDRLKYVNHFWQVINWDFVTENLNKI